MLLAGKWRAWALLAVVLFPSDSPGQVQVSRTWASASHWEVATRDRFVEVSSDPPEVRLARSFLLADDQGITVRYGESITATNWARKEFPLPFGETFGATLLFFGGGAPLILEVNGTPLLHETCDYNGGRWDREEIPPEVLHAGSNTFLFRAEGNARGTLFVEPKDSPGHSSKSEDAGQTWWRDHLGHDGDWPGEYLVHLRVKGYPPKGTLVSEVLDLASLVAKDGIPPQVTVQAVHLEAVTATAPGTAVAFDLRTGTTPSPHFRTWSDWQPVEVETGASRRWQRYVQWRATLTTTHGHRTPALRQVTVTAQLIPDASGTEGMQVTESHNPPLVRSSYDFTYETPHPRVRFLAYKYALDQVVAGAPTELEAQVRLRDWTRRKWLRGWDFGPYTYCPRWDALDILDAAETGFSRGMCTHYATVYAQAATALGYIGRHLIVDHHCLAEVWIDELGRWVVMDPGNSHVPENNCHFERAGVPLNALEIHTAWQRGELDQVQAIYRPPQPPFPADRLHEHNQVSCSNYIRFAIPLRNNHLSTPEPQEEEHGFDHYHYNGYLWWEDNLSAPRFPEYSFLTNRPGDFYWTVNQVAIDLQSTGREGVLRVTLDTLTPNLETFLVQFDGGDWQPIRVENKPYCPSLEWTLKPGSNRLAVKTRNLFGREGRASDVTVVYERTPEG